MIHLLPVDEVSSSILENLGSSLQEVFGVHAVIHEPVGLPATSYEPARHQYLSSPILKSLARLRQEFYGLPPNRALFQQRVLKESVHELGHTYGVGHCLDPACVMHSANSLKDTDYKGWHFCGSCDSVKRTMKHKA